MIYAIHEGGRIVRTFSAPAGYDGTKLEPGAVRVPLDVDLRTHFIKEGAACVIPVSPGEGWVFSYSTGQWVFSDALAWELVRKDRDERLRLCDWRVLPDSPTPEPERMLWQAYRQSLRDITAQSDPGAIAWPAPPG